MPQRIPPFFERRMRRFNPTVRADFLPPLRALGEGLWSADRQLRTPPGLPLPTRMTVLRLPSGGLLLHSPVELDARLCEELAALGPVEALFAPNSFHHVFCEAALKRYPGARFFAAPGLRERLVDLPPGEVLAEEVPITWKESLESAVLRNPPTFSEVALFHRPSKALILTDTAFYMKEIDGPLVRLAWRLFGIPPHFGPSRVARRFFLSDRQRARVFLERILQWDFVRVVVAHGDVLETDAPATFRRAFADYLA